ncbi:hypothetical protein E4U33_006050 [Claviceps sp. LM78 group G4]|nr:hypothetical protein E4U33_006050 [Claviceps sp. LM78 group G4]
MGSYFIWPGFAKEKGQKENNQEIKDNYPTAGRRPLPLLATDTADLSLKKYSAISNSFIKPIDNSATSLRPTAGRRVALMEYTSYRPRNGPMCEEMRQKSTKDAFFTLRKNTRTPRPISVATEFVDMEFDDEFISETEESSPRASLQSVCIPCDVAAAKSQVLRLYASYHQSGPPSFTTASSYDEAPTPRSSRGHEYYPEHTSKQVEGPHGPHLFRNSADSSLADGEYVLTLSPLAPQTCCGFRDLLARPSPPTISSPFKYTDVELESSPLASWTPAMVAQSLLNSGLESSTADRFLENDVDGAILITLKFEDLRHLGIQSFGSRTKIWHQIQALCDSRPVPSRPATPIEDAPSYEARTETRTHSDQGGHILSAEEDPIHPAESASIIGIEQVIPKPHQCSKGSACSTWKQQEKKIHVFKEFCPVGNTKSGRSVVIYGDVGNPDTARAIDPNKVVRPMSDAVPSVVASSDVLGLGGLPPLQYLQEATVKNIEAQDPQDNVRQFLNFQQQSGNTNHVPPTPPFELAPALKPVHEGLRRLPKLSVPGNFQPHRSIPPRASTVSPTIESQMRQHRRRQRQAPTQSMRQPDGPVPYRMDRSTTPMPVDLEMLRYPYRFGTPFSDMDVPVTTVPIGPVARDASQSVPPNMNYHSASGSKYDTHSRSQSRTSGRQTPVSVLSVVNEDIPAHQLSKSTFPKGSSSVHGAPQQQLKQTPPKFNLPWSSSNRPALKEAIHSPSSFRRTPASGTQVAPDGITCQGPMKKRKSRWLRNEWQDGYFTLKGTRLNMHKDAKKMDRTLEYIDIDDYAIACSSLASSSKLSAAFKAVRISHGRKKSDPVGAFSFQLVPQDKNPGLLRLCKRDSVMNGGSDTGPSRGVNGTGKTHHFAVTNRDERIDWMRELLLAKAIKQKSQGFEISVNGNMI